MLPLSPANRWRIEGPCPSHRKRLVGNGNLDELAGALRIIGFQQVPLLCPIGGPIGAVLPPVDPSAFRLSGQGIDPLVIFDFGLLRPFQLRHRISSALTGRLWLVFRASPNVTRPALEVSVIFTEDVLS